MHVVVVLLITTELWVLNQAGTLSSTLCLQDLPAQNCHCSLQCQHEHSLFFPSHPVVASSSCELTQSRLSHDPLWHSLLPTQHFEQGVFKEVQVLDCITQNPRKPLYDSQRPNDYLTSG